MNCTFDSGWCGYFQETTDDFDWQRQNKATVSSGTGPSNDHTTGHGFYVYIETSAPRHRGEKARLTSGIQKPTPQAGVCLSFWYHMYGPYISTLNVYLQTSANSTLQWKRTSNQGNVWRHAQRTIQSATPYQVG